MVDSDLDAFLSNERGEGEKTQKIIVIIIMRERNNSGYTEMHSINFYKFDDVTGKVTNGMLPVAFLSIGGNCEVGSDVCLALIHRDSVMFASFSSLRRLFISALRTSISCFSLWFS